MGQIWVKELTQGLDVRRMPEATSGGVMVKATNGHITRGGEFEQRAAFVPEYSLPAGTIGLFYTPAGIVVFGHLETPTLPSGVSYQRLQHPTPATALVRVLSTDLYAGKIYAVGQFADGSIHHFYDGVRVVDWFDGRARAAFEVTGGVENAAVAATGSFTVTGGTADPTNTISVIVAGVNVAGGPITYTGDNSTTAAAIANAVSSFVSTPDYSASAAGATVTITATPAGSAANGRSVAPTVTGDATVGDLNNMAGGANTATSRLTGLQVNGVSIIGGPVSWSMSNEATAAAIAAAVNAFTSTPDYTATAVGRTVNIAAADPGPGSNDYAVEFVRADGLTTTPLTLAMANGATSTNTYQPGEFVQTIGQKIYSTSGPNMHFSGIQQPTKWTTDAVGAGFVDMSSETSGSEQLTALARYQNFAAIFAARVVQIWFVDPDPKLNRQVQVLNNTGTDSPRSVTSFGDTDIFYLDESGVRSLRARDSSNAAVTTDIGTPIDDLIIAKLKPLNAQDRRNVIGLIEPQDGRFWLIMTDGTVFVFSYFTGAKVSAWSTYETSFFSGDIPVPFTVTDAVVFNRRVYLRSGNTIFVYGGLAGEVYDETIAEAWLPYLDANDPTREKHFNGLDVAIRGLWSVSAAMSPNDQTAEDLVGDFGETTYNLSGKNVFDHHATHISLRFRSQGIADTGAHRLGACVIQYEGNDDDD